jgi:hypothetical protein
VVPQFGGANKKARISDNKIGAIYFVKCIGETRNTQKILVRKQKGMVVTKQIRDKILHRYKTRGVITVLITVLSFTFLDIGREEKGFFFVKFCEHSTK